MSSFSQQQQRQNPNGTTTTTPTSNISTTTTPTSNVSARQTPRIIHQRTVTRANERLARQRVEALIPTTFSIPAGKKWGGGNGNCRAFVGVGDYVVWLRGEVERLMRENEMLRDGEGQGVKQEDEGEGEKRL